MPHTSEIRMYGLHIDVNAQYPEAFFYVFDVLLFELWSTELDQDCHTILI